MSMTRFLLPLIFVLATCWANKPISENVSPQFFQEKELDLPNFRLPKNIIPTHYYITLRPVFNTSDETNFTFTGTSVIKLHVMKATNKIIFHAKNLDIDDAALKVQVPSIPPVPSYLPLQIEEIIKDEVEQRDFMTLVLERTVNDGFLLELTLNFTGKLDNEDLYGFYKSSYKNEKGEKVWLGATHFQPTGARRAFPCWDEPALKAKFTITIVTPESPVKYHAISNMKINEEQSSDNIIVFNESPNMSSYLVAFVISNFENNTNGDFTVWTKPQAINSTDFALKIGQEVIKEMEDYTDFKYKNQEIQKIDQISIPDLSPTAMENWGLITYRESALLYTENKTTTASKKSIVTTISHELAHQWFGNLVTCMWWDYIWLNEGFANFFQYFIAEKIMQKKSELQDWRFMEQFAIQNLQASAFVTDASSRTRPLNPKNSVKTPNQISNLFDSVAYSKGGSIIRMMQQFLGPDIFQKGLRHYLKKHKFSAVNSDNLFEAIEDMIEVSKNESKNIYVTEDELKNITFKTIMKNWVNEPGYPVVTVTRNESDLNIKQNRFFLIQPTILDKTEWYIPVDYVTQDAVEEIQGLLLKPGEQLTITNVTNAANWVLFNKDQTGYYRVNYDDANWGLLAAFLNTNNYINITAVNRAQLIDDALNLARGEYLKYDVALSITEYLSKETDYIPWYAAIRAFNFLDSVLQDAKKDFHKYVASKIAIFAQSVRYEDPYNGTHVEKLAKVLALNAACKYGLETCNKFVDGELNAYLNNGKTLPSDLRSGILCAGLRTANNETMKKALNKYINITDEDEKADILAGLGCITSEETINEFLELTFKKDLLFNALNSVCMNNVASFNVIMKFLVQNNEKIQNTNSNMLTGLLNVLAMRVTTNEQYVEIMSFITRMLPEAQRESINKGLENALENIAWIKHHREKVVKWIQDHEKDQPEPTTPLPSSANSLTLTSLLVIIPLLLARF